MEKTYNEASLNMIIERIKWELGRQAALKALGKFPCTCMDVECSDTERLAILVEVARAICDKDDVNKFEELVQVAAVTVSWLIGIYNRDIMPLEEKE
jgi:hypothetical protein